MELTFTHNFESKQQSSLSTNKVKTFTMENLKIWADTDTGLLSVYAAVWSHTFNFSFKNKVPLKWFFHFVDLK